MLLTLNVLKTCGPFWLPKYTTHLSAPTPCDSDLRRWLGSWYCWSRCPLHSHCCRRDSWTSSEDRIANNMSSWYLSDSRWKRSCFACEWASNHNKQLLLFSFYYFLNAPESTIECTFKATTQFAYLVWLTGHIFDTHKAPFPAIRVRRHNEHVATDTIYVNVSAYTLDPLLPSYFAAQKPTSSIYMMCRQTLIFPQILMDKICKREAMYILILCARRCFQQDQRYPSSSLYWWLAIWATVKTSKLCRITLSLCERINQ